MIFLKKFPQNNVKCIKKKYIFLFKMALRSVLSPTTFLQLDVIGNETC
jgi:hypothetical protein